MIFIKFGKYLFFVKHKITILLNRCPRRLKVFVKPLFGGLAGFIIGGIPGFFIGLLLGYLLGELFSQTSRDKKIIEYLENPSAQHFNESEPGMAAWCALGVLVASKNQTINSAGSAAGKKLPVFDYMAERILKQVFLEACYTFNSPALDPSQIEYFSRLAWQKTECLNPDLLAESFAYRRSPTKDAGNLISRLSRFAENEKSKTLAKEIILNIDPSYREAEQQSSSATQKDPWKILGLSPETPLKEIKAHYRRLAKQFHPDNLTVLDEKQRDAAARAFMAIKEAYNQVMGEYPAFG